MFQGAVFQEAKCYLEKSVLGSKLKKGKVLQGAKCAGEQSVPKEQSVPESKVFQGAECSSSFRSSLYTLL